MRAVRAMFGRRNVVRDGNRIENLPVLPPDAKKILIVDDDPVFIKATSLLLNQQGYAVVAAQDGSEAIQAMREEKPNLVLMDINLTDKSPNIDMVSWNGFSLMSWVRRFEDLRSIPIVMVSSGDPLKCVRRALTGGARAFFHKSTSTENLIATVRQVLSDRMSGARPVPAANFNI